MRINRIFSVALISGLVSVAAVSHADSLLERIAMAVLADKFGINTQEVNVLRQQTQLPVYQLAPIYEGSRYFAQKPSTIWQLRNQGLGWGEIAHRVGMHPGTFNKLRKKGAFDQDQFWQTSYRERFNVPTQQVVVMRKAGGSLEDVLGAIIVGKLTKQNPSTVYNQFQAQKSWNTITTNSNVRFEDWRRVSVPVQPRYILFSPTTKVKARSDGDRDRDFGKNKSKESSHSSKGKRKGGGELTKSKGKGGSDHAKGQGNGKGRGNGKSKGKGGKGKGG
jgi:hypothetical protein